MTEESRADRWEGFRAGDLAEAWGVPAVHLFARTGSTNDRLRGLAEAGVPAWSVVLAEEQTAGRGRGGKGWSSPPGLGIWMSVLLRPAELASPGLLPVLAGLAAAEAVEPLAAPARATVKWPNDLYLDGLKAAGVLCEGTWDGGRPASVVVGIGINVGHLPGDFPPELRDTATSLRIAAGWSPPRAELAGAVVGRLRARLDPPPARLDAELRERLGARDFLLGRRVAVTGAEEVRGTAMGITPEGALLVRTEAGVLRSLHAGTVRVMGEEGESRAGKAEAGETGEAVPRLSPGG